MAEGSQTFGVWKEKPAAESGVISHDRMLLDARHLSQHWRRCSISSDFWARFISLSSSRFLIDKPVNQDAVESILSYLLNELFENCAKFSGGPVQDVIYEAWLFPERVEFQVTNHIEDKSKQTFVKLIQELLSSDPDELYFKRLEENAETDGKGSGLGYLTLMKDYKVRFGFRFTPISQESVAVDVQAHINVKEI